MRCCGVLSAAAMAWIWSSWEVVMVVLFRCFGVGLNKEFAGMGNNPGLIVSLLNSAEDTDRITLFGKADNNGPGWPIFIDCNGWHCFEG